MKIQIKIWVERGTPTFDNLTFDNGFGWFLSSIASYYVLLGYLYIYITIFVQQSRTVLDFTDCKTTFLKTGWLRFLATLRLS